MEPSNLKTKGIRRDDANNSSGGNEEIEAPPHKVGYLSKYQDREVSGLTGSKWAKRFVVLENGDLCYYKDHTDKFPRYVLHLRDCAVR
jgi:hypothetical protein